MATPPLALIDFKTCLLTALQNSQAVLSLTDPTDEHLTWDTERWWIFTADVAPPSVFNAVVRLEIQWDTAEPTAGHELLVQCDFWAHLQHQPVFDSTAMQRWVVAIDEARRQVFPFTPRATAQQAGPIWPDYGDRLVQDWPYIKLSGVQRPGESPIIRPDEIGLRFYAKFTLTPANGIPEIDSQVADFARRVAQMWDEWDRLLMDCFAEDIRPPGSLRVVNLTSGMSAELGSAPVPESYIRPPLVYNLYRQGHADASEGRAPIYAGNTAEEDLVRTHGERALEAYQAGYQAGVDETRKRISPN